MKTHLDNPVLPAVLSLFALVGMAQAQTVVTRQISDEPVETVVQQDPGGTVVTRRLLDTTPAPLATSEAELRAFPLPPSQMYSPRAEQTTVWTTRYPAAAQAANTGAVDYTMSARPVGNASFSRSTRSERVVARDPQQRRTVTRRTASRSANYTRTHASSVSVGRAVPAAPLALNDAQRRTIYQTVMQQEPVAPASSVVVTPQEVITSSSWVPPILQPFHSSALRAAGVGSD
jgi:hypothetical protein